MTEQPNQQPYPYQQPPYPQAPPQQQGYQNPYGQQPPQQAPYPPQQYGAPQVPQQPYPQQQQPYPQGPPQQYQGQQQQYSGQQQYPGQQFSGQQQYPGQQFPGQPYGQPPQGPDQAQAAPKPKKKRSRWLIFFIVLFSPLIAIAFVVYGIYWVLAWLLTPVALVIHFALCGVGLIWFSAVKVLASGRSKYRLLQPVYPKCPPFWTGSYWVRLNGNVRSTVEGLGAIVQLLDW